MTTVSAKTAFTRKELEVTSFFRRGIVATQEKFKADPSRPVFAAFPIPAYLKLLEQLRIGSIEPINDDRFMLDYEDAHCSHKSIEDLQKISMAEVGLNKRSDGRYLLVRVIGKLAIGQGAGFELPVADPEGSVASLITYLFPPPVMPQWKKDDLEAYDTTYSVGTIIAVKEPAFRIGHPMDVLRVDSPTDMLVLEEGDPLLQGILWKGIGKLDEEEIWLPSKEKPLGFYSWKTMGNDLYMKRKLLQADRCFSRGIRQHPEHPLLYLLYLNRSANRLGLERYPQALLDARKALELMQPYLTTSITARAPIELTAVQGHQAKAFIRVAKAYYNMRSWTLAAESYDVCVKAYPDCLEALRGLSQAQIRMKEEKTGCYDVDSLCTSQPHQRLDVADFIGPVEVRQIKGMGRGLVTTRNVKAGELLLANKAIMYLPPKEITSGTRLVAWRGEGSSEFSPASNTSGYHSVIYKMLHQPYIALLVNQLTSGSSGLPATMLANPFQLPPVDQPLPSSFGLDIQDVIRKCDTNWFSLDDGAKALFPYTSFINHSCVPNTGRCDIGDFQSFYATEDLPRGTQIYTSYFGNSLQVYEVRQKCSFYWDKTKDACRCPLCQYDRANVMEVQERFRLKDQWEKGRKFRTEPSPPIVNKNLIIDVRKTISAMEGTYGKEWPLGSYKPELFSPYRSLGAMRGNERRLNTSVLLAGMILGEISSGFFEAIESLGVNIKGRKSGRKRPGSRNVKDVPANIPIASLPRTNTVDAVLGISYIIAEYQLLGKEQTAQQWFEAARWISYMTQGRSKEMFRATWPELTSAYPQWF